MSITMSATASSRHQRFQERGPTIIDLFVSGYDEVTFEKDPLDPENEFMRTRHSWIGESKPHADASAGAFATYIPDPPCIMPFKRDEFAEEEFEGDGIPRVVEYWKDFAGWLEQWPSLKRYRDAQDEFCSLWRHTPAESRLRGFVVLAANSVGMRFRPGLAEEEKNGQILLPGQCIPVEETQVTDNNRFLKLPGPGAGWVFEYKDSMQVMAEMRSIEVGMWWYNCEAVLPVEVRKSPTWDDSARSGFVLNPQEVVVVNIRCKLNGYTFVHLFDGRGWVFELSPGTLKNDSHASTLVMSECEHDFMGLGDMHALQSLVPSTSEVVEVGQWTYITNLEPVLAVGSRRYGHFLAPGSVVKVDKRANSSGRPRGFESSHAQDRLWLRLSDGDGWVPETDENGNNLMLLQETNEVSYPSWFQPGTDPNPAPQRWEAGVV